MDAIENIEKGGTVVVVGVFAERRLVDLGLMQDRELKLVGKLMYKYEDYVKALEMFHSGKIYDEQLSSKHFQFEDYTRVYNFINEHGHKTMKVFIDL